LLAAAVRISIDTLELVVEVFGLSFVSDPMTTGEW
jgi:hypothetical protein